MYKIKELIIHIEKMEVKTFRKRVCSRLVRLALVRNMCGQLSSVEMLCRWYGLSSYISDILYISSSVSGKVHFI